MIVDAAVDKAGAPTAQKDLPASRRGRRSSSPSRRAVSEFDFPLPLHQLPVDRRYPLFTCPADLTIRLLAEYLADVLAAHDATPAAHSGAPSRFHAQAIPKIDILSYLVRFLKYAPAGNECFLGLFALVDALCHMTPLHVWAAARRRGRAPIAAAALARARAPVPLYITSYNVNRLLITGMVVAMKFFSDVFYTNRHMARVGGLSLGELNALEVEFLLLADFTLMTPIEVLGRYGQLLLDYALLKRSAAPPTCFAWPEPSLPSPPPSVAAAEALPHPAVQDFFRAGATSLPLPQACRPRDALHPPPVRAAGAVASPTTPSSIGSTSAASSMYGTLRDSGYDSLPSHGRTPRSIITEISADEPGCQKSMSLPRSFSQTGISYAPATVRRANTAVELPMSASRRASHAAAHPPCGPEPADRAYAAMMDAFGPAQASAPSRTHSGRSTPYLASGPREWAHARHGVRPAGGLVGPGSTPGSGPRQRAPTCDPHVPLFAHTGQLAAADAQPGGHLLVKRASLPTRRVSLAPAAAPVTPISGHPAPYASRGAAEGLPGATELYRTRSIHGLRAQRALQHQHGGRRIVETGKGAPPPPLPVPEPLEVICEDSADVSGASAASALSAGTAGGPAESSRSASQWSRFLFFL